MRQTETYRVLKNTSFSFAEKRLASCSIHVITQTLPYFLRVLMLSWRRNIDVYHPWDIFYKKFTTRKKLATFFQRNTMGCLAALHLSSLSRTGVFLSTSLTLGGLSMLHLFIYLLHSSDMFGHPCLQYSVGPITKPGWWHWMCVLHTSSTEVLCFS